MAKLSVEIVPDSSGAVNVRVVLPEIPEHSKAYCFVLSELSLILKPSSSVTTALQVNEDKPLIVEAVPPNATDVLPIVTELLANCALGIELVPKAPVLEL